MSFEFTFTLSTRCDRMARWRITTEPKKRYTDKQRAAYWKRKYFSCKRTHENLLRRMKNW